MYLFLLFRSSIIKSVEEKTSNKVITASISVSKTYCCDHREIYLVTEEIHEKRWSLWFAKTIIPKINCFYYHSTMKCDLISPHRMILLTFTGLFKHPWFPGLQSVSSNLGNVKNRSEVCDSVTDPTLFSGLRTGTGKSLSTNNFRTERSLPQITGPF